MVVTFGQAADRAVVGDWDGNGTATPGVVRGQAFVLRAGLAADAGTRRTFADPFGDVI